MARSIPIEEENIRILVDGICRAISQDMPEIIYENQLPTSVGSGLFQYNFVYRNLLNKIDNSDFEFSLQRRGSWWFIILYDRVSGFTFTIMSEQNLTRLQNDKKLQGHYLQALVLYNERRQPQCKQLTLFDVEKKPNFLYLLNLREQLLSGFTNPVGEHVLVLFDAFKSEIIFIRAALLTPELEIAIDDNWSEYISETYFVNESLVALVNNVEPEDEPLAKLKKDVEEEERDTSVTLASSKDDEEQEER